MSHKSVRLLIRDTVKSIRTDVNYTYARPSDFNIVAQFDGQPFVTLDAMTASPSYATDGVYNYVKSWNCAMAFYEFDKADQDIDHTAKVLDRMDDFVDKFLNKLNTYMTDSDSILISGITQTPAIKVTANIISGYTLSFSLQVQDDFDYCSVDCVDGDDC